MRRFKLKRKQKRKLASTAGLALIAVFIYYGITQNGLFPPVSLPGRAPKHPTDPGRLSLIQVEKVGGENRVVNQRDGSFALTENITLVDGRTPQRKAVSIPFENGAARIPIQDNFDYAQGSVAFWINTDVWNDNLQHLFFAVESLPSHNFAIFKAADGAGIDSLRAGIGPNLSSIISEDIPSGAWHLIVMTYQPGDFVRLYLDDALVSTSPVVYAGDAQPATAGNCFVLICWGTSLFFTAGAQSTLEDMQTFNYALSPDQVLELYNSRFPVSFYELGP